jgi:hypothetical protein
MKVFGSLYIDPNNLSAGNTAEAIRLSKLYPSTVVGLSCGLEVAWENKDMPNTAKAVNLCISQLRAAGLTQPIGKVFV